MRTTKAQRLRFGVLAARHELERSRLTDWHIDYLEGCEAVGWRVHDSRRAYEREALRAQARAFAKRIHASCRCYIAGPKARD